VVSTDWAGPLIEVNDDSVTLTHGARAYLATAANDELTPGNYKQYVLKDKTLSFDVDLSGISCSCNAALYTVSMPGLDQSGQPAKSDSGDYYCDANNVGGVWCWEMDIMEANKYIVQTTPHKCDQAAGTHISNCDRGGCSANTWDVSTDAFGPGKTIDTNKTFRQHTSFTGGKIHIKYEQDGKTFEMDACQDSGYVWSMDDTFAKGMTIVMSYWGDSYGSMAWLDQRTGCGGDCDTNGEVTWSNIEISDANSSLEGFIQK
jgi:cellulose 1,4-beta-cellobiosidase